MSRVWTLRGVQGGAPRFARDYSETPSKRAGLARLRWLLLNRLWDPGRSSPAHVEAGVGPRSKGLVKRDPACTGGAVSGPALDNPKAINRSGRGEGAAIAAGTSWLPRRNAPAAWQLGGSADDDEKAALDGELSATTSKRRRLTICVFGRMSRGRVIRPKGTLRSGRMNQTGRILAGLTSQPG